MEHQVAVHDLLVDGHEADGGVIDDEDEAAASGLLGVVHHVDGGLAVELDEEELLAEIRVAAGDRVGIQDFFGRYERLSHHRDSNLAHREADILPHRTTRSG